MTRVLIHNCELVATMDDRATRFRNGHVLFEGPRILAVGAGDPLPDADEQVDAAHKVALPGLINTHHHLYQTLTRNLPPVQNAPLFDWLTYLYEVWRELTEEAVFVSAQVGLGELLLSGCTTSSDHLYLFPRSQSPRLIDRELEAARALGIRFHPTRGSMSRGKSQGGLPPDEVVQTEEEILDDCRRLLDEYHDAGEFSLCRLAFAPCSPFSVTERLMEQTVALARQHGVRCHTHLAETLDEERYCLEHYGCRPVELAERLGWLGPDIWFAHCVHLNEADIRKMADTKTGVAHCPASNCRLGSGRAPIMDMQKAGIPVGLAVDGSASNDSSNLLAEVRLAMLLHRLPLRGHRAPERWFTAEDALRLATRGSAAVLGRDDLGSLEPGKAADIVLIDTRQLSLAGAMSDPLAALVFSPPPGPVDTVWVNGEKVVDHGRLCRAKESELIERANRLSTEMLQRAEARRPRL